MRFTSHKFRQARVYRIANPSTELDKRQVFTRNAYRRQKLFLVLLSLCFVCLDFRTSANRKHLNCVLAFGSGSFSQCIYHQHMLHVHVLTYQLPSIVHTHTQYETITHKCIYTTRRLLTAVPLHVRVNEGKKRRNRREREANV